MENRLFHHPGSLKSQELIAGLKDRILNEERSRTMEKLIGGVVIIVLCIAVFLFIRADVKKS